MATRIYFVRNDETVIDIRITPVTIGIASTVVKLKKSGGSVIDVADSGNDATGRIKKTHAGASSDLLNAVLVATTVINLTAVPKEQWDPVFDNLRITYHLEGGVDGPQDFNIDIDDKTKIMGGKIIMATKAIKFNTH